MLTTREVNHWQMDEGALIHEKGLEMVRNIYADLLKTSDYRDRMAIEKYAVLSESVRRREAFVKAASWIKGLNITSDCLDRNPWLLNVQNGTIDLRTREFREHRQEDFITKAANVVYDPAADCPACKQFIREIKNFNSDIITFLQTAAGLSLTGDTLEQTMFIWKYNPGDIMLRVNTGNKRQVAHNFEVYDVAVGHVGL
ncbi:hypothetical protein AGMMS49940_24210 [Spirochaetia bacterium]|nr:hypothetical protein AGMMS49940_24210 [Spirochaetia bacterium]